MAGPKLGKREKAVRTRKGIILYHAGRDKWYLSYPTGVDRIGGATTIRVMNFIYYLSKGKTIEEADHLAFEAPRVRHSKRR